MLEQIGNAIKVAAFFTEAKVGKTGLTVTVDAYAPDGTQIVTGAAAVAVGGGLYSYTLASGSVTTEGEYLFIFKTATATVDQQHIPAIYVVGRAGVENLDAAISSRSTYAGGDTAGTTTLLTRLTAGRATNLDNLDAAVSSRLSTAGYTVPPTVVAIRGELDANSTKLANLDVAVSTRSTYAGADTAGTTTLLARLTGARALLLDNLSGIDATISSRMAASSYVAPANADVSAIKVVTDRLNTGIELDGAVYRATANFLEQAPVGAGGASVWTTGEKDAVLADAAAAKNNSSSILARIGDFSGTTINTIKGYLLALANKNAALPSELGNGAVGFNPATDSLEAIRDRGDLSWLTGAGGGGGGGFTGPNAVNLLFTDAALNPVPLVTFSVVGTDSGIIIGSMTADAGGSATIGLPAGSYTIVTVPQSYVIWPTRVIEVPGGSLSHVITGTAVSSSELSDRNAEYLVNLVRELINEKGANHPYRDGFADDEGYKDTSKSILTFVNSAQRMLAETGYIKCYFNRSVLPATDTARNDEYALSNCIHEILTVNLMDIDGRVYPIPKTDHIRLDTERLQRRTRQPARPRGWYWYGQVIGLDEAPDAPYVLQVLANTFGKDLVLRTDTPYSLPGLHQEAIAYGAALLLSNTDAREEARTRIPFLTQMWNWHLDGLRRIARTRPINDSGQAMVTTRRPR